MCSLINIIKIKFKNYQKDNKSQKVKRGHFLLELSIYTMICSISLILISNITFLIVKEYKTSIKERTNYSKLFNVENHIECLLNKPNILEISEEDGNLNIDYLISKNENLEEKVQSNRIYLDKGKLNIEYTKFLDNTTKNTLLTGVKNFQAIEKGNLIYIYIKLENGEEKVMCYEK